MEAIVIAGLATGRGRRCRLPGQSLTVLGMPAARVKLAARVLGALTILGLLSGCYGVTSTTLVGAAPAKIVPADWEGTWRHRDGTVTVAVVDGAAGHIQVGWVEKRKGKLVPEIYDAWLRESGDWTFGNIRDPQHPKRFYWARIENRDGEMVIWIPDRTRWRELVGDRKVAGRVDANGEDVVLDDFTGADAAIAPVGDDRYPLDRRRPLLFLRIVRP